MHRVVDKLLHEPTVRVKELAAVARRHRLRRRPARPVRPGHRRRRRRRASLAERRRSTPSTPSAREAVVTATDAAPRPRRCGWAPGPARWPAPSRRPSPTRSPRPPGPPVELVHDHAPRATAPRRRSRSSAAPACSSPRSGRALARGQHRPRRAQLQGPADGAGARADPRRRAAARGPARRARRAGRPDPRRAAARLDGRHRRAPPGRPAAGPRPGPGDRRRSAATSTPGWAGSTARATSTPSSSPAPGWPASAGWT